MKIIIVGCGKIGSTIARELNDEGHHIVVIDNNPHAVENLTSSIDLMGIEGNGASYETLQEAEIESTDLIIAVTGADELNIYCCLLARSAGVKHTIARVRNPEYTNDLPRVKDILGLSLSINPELNCAREIDRLLKFPGAIEIDTFAKGVVELIKINVPENSFLSNVEVKSTADFFKGKVRICTVERDGETFIPNGDFVIYPNDKISLLASSSDANKILKKLGLITSRSRSVVILGGSKTAFYLADFLIKAGVDVKIIEKNKQRCETLAEMLHDAEIINGNCMDLELMAAEGVENATGIVALMNNDEENILISIYLRKISNAKIITKINNESFSSIVDSLKLDSIINPKHLAGEQIAKYVRSMQNSLGSSVETLYNISENNDVEALEFRVKEESKVTGIPLKDLRLKDDLQIACINRSGKIIRPSGLDTIELHDTVIVVTKHKGLSQLNDILK
ncbi:MULTISPECIES: Trk system potassium transporter TrkA [unclassified Ruminococcus]|uniref:Trk system potassium transporter TrkA n=1 Tax=unclassified Ruminococcus TaxID=2608920 RepID=UPI00210BBA69|nr:Trk system potassium transporter TrkA [Ruminococcus sp. zg-924]MCQ4114902.1 Trk system potassium transporter TrkA [Ruminococcus sp. zg-921]